MGGRRLIVCKPETKLSHLIHEKRTRTDLSECQPGKPKPSRRRDRPKTQGRGKRGRGFSRWASYWLRPAPAQNRRRPFLAATSQMPTPNTATTRNGARYVWRTGTWSGKTRKRQYPRANLAFWLWMDGSQPPNARNRGWNCRRNSTGGLRRRTGRVS